MAEVTLTAADITALLSETRDRGGAERILRQFATSGELAQDIMELPQYAKKNRDSTYNSLNSNIKKIKADSEKNGKDWPNIRLVKKTDDDDVEHLFVINVDLYSAAMAEAEGSENGNEPTVEGDE